MSRTLPALSGPFNFSCFPVSVCRSLSWSPVSPAFCYEVIAVRALCCVNVLRMCSCSDSKQDFNNPDFITMYTLKFPCVSWWVLWIMSMNMSMLTLSDYDWLDTCIPSHPLQLPFVTEGSIASPNPSLHPLLGCFVFLLLRSFMIHGGSMPNPFFLLFP